MKKLLVSCAFRNTILMLLLFPFFSYVSGADSIITYKLENHIIRDTNITYDLFKGNNNTFGYNILVNGKLTVHQPSIPCLTGNTGFRYKKDAEKVAKLVVSKIKKGIMPPTVTIKEMETLGISLLQ